MKSPHEHNQDIQRQVEKRLREIDDEINAVDQPVYQTRKHQPEQAQKPWLRKVILGGKFFALAVATLVAVRVASVLAGVVIFGALAFLVYKLFLESKLANISSKYQPYQYQPKSTNPQIPKQQVYTYTPPKQNTPQNPPPKVETPRQQVNTPPPNPAELEAKFQAWEFEQEIAEIKVNMKSSSSSQKAQTPPKTPAQQDKIAVAYRILGLQPTAAFIEVKQAYKTLVKKWHPDLFVNKPQMQKQVQEKMRLVNQAYNILNDHHS